VHAQIRSEADDAAWTATALVEIKDLEGGELLYRALHAEFGHQRKRVLDLLALVAPPNAIRRAQDVLNTARATAEQRAYALEALDIVTPKDLKPIILALVDDLSPVQRQQRLSVQFPQPAMNRSERVCAIIVDGGDRFSAWTQACALDAAARWKLRSLLGVVVDATHMAEPLVAETAAWVLARMGGDGRVAVPSGGQIVREGAEVRMLSTIERVIILKTINMFAAVPEDTLAAVAGVVEELEASAGTPVFRKGDLGQEMYIIVAGSVRIHDGEQVINRLGAYDVFGEMALLDSEPRSASVTTEEDTLLLRLHQDDFFDLFEDHSAIARGIIEVLSQRLRARSEELARLRSERQAEQAA
jgi:CRP-like cAMP-binding protein